MRLTTQIKYKDLDIVKKQISDNNCELLSYTKIGKYASIVVVGEVNKLNI